MAVSFPSVSIEEHGDGYVLTADVPSFRKGDIKVHLGDQNRRLIIEGQAGSHERFGPADEGGQQQQQQQQPEKASDDQQQQQQQQQATSSTAMTKDGQQAGQVARTGQGQMLFNERQTFAQFRRSFHFAQPLDPKTVKAKLEHGQLSVCVNKQKEDAGVTSIDVE